MQEYVYLVVLDRETKNDTHPVDAFLKILKTLKLEDEIAVIDQSRLTGMVTVVCSEEAAAKLSLLRIVTHTEQNAPVHTQEPFRSRPRTPGQP